jgi:hypothetical protein
MTAHGGACQLVSFGALTCTDSGDLVGFMERGDTGCAVSWGNRWGNRLSAP